MKRLDTIEEKILYTFPDAPIMLEVAKAESSLRPLVKNPGSTAFGLFQILEGTFNDPRYGCSGERGDVWTEIDCARRIYDIDGLRPWEASRSVWGDYIQ